MFDLLVETNFAKVLGIRFFFILEFSTLRGAESILKLSLSKVIALNYSPVRSV